MLKPSFPKIMDITVKEGGFRVHHHLLPHQVADIARELQRAGIQYAEVSHGRGIGGKKAGYPAIHSDKELLQAAREAAPSLTYGVYVATFPYSLFELEGLAEYFEIGRVGINIDEVEKGIEYLKRIRSLKKTAIAQLLRIHSRPLQETLEAAQKLEDAGADVLYLTDSFGSMDGAEVGATIHAVTEKLKIPIGFQGRNNTGRALDNTLKALEAGAQWLDGSLLGMGLGAGVTPLEILISLLHRKGLGKEINLAELTNAAQHFALPALRTLPKTDWLDLLFAKHKIDLYPRELIGSLAEILELSPEVFLTELGKMRPGIVQLYREDLRNFFAKEKLDLDVVTDYLKTGEIPQ